MATNGTMMQYFEWYLPSGMLWKQLKEHAAQLKEDGITAVWIPPAYKGSAGINDVGYGSYDLYDLGEFDQKGTVPTKYGSKNELHDAISTLHDQGIQVYADIVLDHKLGADGTEWVTAKEFNPKNRYEAESNDYKIEAWTHFTFPGRSWQYSAFEWHWYHFIGIDWDEKRNKQAIYKFHGKEWEEEVDRELGNYDYLMGADIDLDNDEVKEDLKNWGKWFIAETNVDGFRLDAVKHMKFSFYNEWLDFLRREVREELFTVGEYWNGDLPALKNYIDTTQGALSLFDVPLHYRLHDASSTNGAFDMRTIFDDTLTQDNPLKSVTFVDNHDTQPGQSLQSWVEEWFKPHAYALILLRENAYPCIFYGDYYGIAHNDIPAMRDKLLPLLKARTNLAYGKQNDYFDHPDIVGWTREGDEEHENSGLAVLLTNAEGGQKRMYVGKQFAGQNFIDCTGNHDGIITIENDGNGNFAVNNGSLSVWVKQS